MPGRCEWSWGGHRLRALVTGAGGMIGSRLVRILAGRADVRVRALVRHGSDTSRLEGYEDRIIYGDLNQLNDSGTLLDEIDCIYHLAAATSGSHYEMMMNTVVATERLMESLKHHKVERFVLVSSFSVYQMSALKPGDILDESCSLEEDLAARDSYTITKVRQERLVHDWCRRLGIPLVVVRPGKIYGPGDNPVPPQVGLAIPGICYFFIGGNNLLPLTHVDNCAQAIYLAGITSGVEGKAINIVDDRLPTGRQYLRWYESVLGKLPRKIWMPYKGFKLVAHGFEVASRRTKGNIPPLVTRYRAENLWKNLRYDNTRAKTLLGWRPEIDIKTGVMETLDQFHRDSKG